MKKPDGFHLLASLGELHPAQWDDLLRATDPAAAPCLRHAYLHALEREHCVGGRSGWTPAHASLWRNGELVAAMPLYLKAHSYGEYVFDWAWAEAYQRHGLDYYPKWLAAVPFTPIPGARLLGPDPDDRRQLLEAVLARVRDSGLSSFHLLFPNAQDAAILADAGLMMREGVQFHWQNGVAGRLEGDSDAPLHLWPDFDAFLASLNHDKRKKIRQERRRAAAHGLNLRWLDGHAASAAEWDFFHHCYALTYALHRSTPYLGASFFHRLAARMPDAVRLLLAEREGAPVAAAFFLCDKEALYGRYWGAIEPLPFLHFELCYYQAIEYCIAQGLRRFEGGAQGEHKLSRGLLPVRTQSAHWIADPRFRNAVDDYLARERNGIGFYLDELAERSPFRRDLTPA
ncbi:MAG TPA: GNAT family N-acetyltransferase [Thauera sp.]|uniref:GNAT family N-acetyltransferase n=1 Tax=Thauera sp. TaxID=1905334 RepID=UPI002BDBF808|nr:GNAT family N-acetyltransferase [Thauera sp.]HRP23250.1 GNAT family N-acetyltransferase [Thauera sp.]HRP64688.1 GNAT family N-acetyltransferase [Thauera sp.]